MMKQAHQAMFVNPKPEGGLTAYSIDEDQQKKYEKHRDTLVDRGFLFKEVYVFDNVRSRSERASALLKTLLRWPPYPLVDFNSPQTDKRQPLKITLWGKHADKNGWDEFFRDQDRPAQPAAGKNDFPDRVGRR
jgi:hypothetical protein